MTKPISTLTIKVRYDDGSIETVTNIALETIGNAEVTLDLIEGTVCHRSAEITPAPAFTRAIADVVKSITKMQRTQGLMTSLEQAVAVDLAYLSKFIEQGDDESHG